MSQYKVKNVNYICAGKNGKLINIDLDILSNGVVVDTIWNYTLLADVEYGMEQMEPQGEYNKHSFKCTSINNTTVHSLFEPQDTAFKSVISKITEKQTAVKTVDSFIDVYAPQLYDNPIQSTQIYNMIYTLTDKNNDGPNYKTTDLKTNASNTGYYYSNQIYSSKLNTYVYGTKSERSGKTLHEQFIPKSNFCDLNYNYMIEMNVNDENSRCNYFNNGIVLAEIFQTKNAYDSLYSMSMPNQNVISCCRDYCGMDSCAGELYLKYYDNIKNTKNASTTEDGLNIINTVTGYCDTVKKYPFQKIETFTSINRFRNNIKHKSNLYSVRLKNCGLNKELYKEEDILKKVELLQCDIKNNIRAITEKICPAETQLFDVYFEGD